MTPLFQKILLFSAMPVLTMIAGSSIAIFRRPSGNARSFILHFAAGVVFSVVTVELLPDVVKEHKPLQVIVGFTLGLVTMLLVKHFAEAKEKQEPSAEVTGKLPMGLLLGIGIDILIDGLLLGIGFSAGSTEGVLLAVALSIELLSLGMAVTTELGGARFTPRRSMAVTLTLALIFFVSAAGGAFLLHNLSDSAMEVVLSFGLSALLFLVTEELLIEAHEEEETVWHTSAFFLGFLVFLILGMIA